MELIIFAFSLESQYTSNLTLLVPPVTYVTPLVSLKTASTQQITTNLNVEYLDSTNHIYRGDVGTQRFRLPLFICRSICDNIQQTEKGSNINV